MSEWIARVDNGEPRNAVKFITIIAAALLCLILPSQVAFTSMLSAGAIPLIASYGLIALLRLCFTFDKFKSTKFKLGSMRKPFYIAATLFNALFFAVSF